MISIRVVVPNFRNHSFVESYKIKEFPLYKQPDQITCGPATVYMVLRFYKLNIDFEDVKESTKTEWISYDKTSIGMTSPDYIRNALYKYKISNNMHVGNIDELKYYVSKNTPVIVLLRSGSKTWHYVVVVGYEKNKIEIADPSNGKRYFLNENIFVDSWRFKKDLYGYDVVEDCFLCKGTGTWFYFNLGPLFICELCSGTGKQPDYVLSSIKNLDVYPETMIVPKF